MNMQSATRVVAMKLGRASFWLAMFAAVSMWLPSDEAIAQSQILAPMPPQSGTFTGNARGYWFTAPSSFVITGVQIPTDASTGNQNIAILRLNAEPPIFSDVPTNDFTTLFLTQNDVTPGLITTRIAVTTGEFIGVLGSRSDVASYSFTGNSTTIDGASVPLKRFGMQFPLATSAPQNVWQQTTGNISRVFLYYDTGFLVKSEASPLAGGTVVCSPDVVAENTSTTCSVTPNPGFSVSNVSGCGVTATTPPYVTAAVNAHCTVTATFFPCPIASIGVCGPAQNAFTANAPTANLCVSQHGNSAVARSGNDWLWTCNGTNPCSPAACSAPATACTLDIDGDGVVNTTIDALIHARIALGMFGPDVLNGLSIPPNAVRPDWTSIRAHLNARCGLTIP